MTATLLKLPVRPVVPGSPEDPDDPPAAVAMPEPPKEVRLRVYVVDPEIWREAA